MKQLETRPVAGAQRTAANTQTSSGQTATAPVARTAVATPATTSAQRLAMLAAVNAQQAMANANATRVAPPVSTQAPQPLRKIESPLSAAEKVRQSLTPPTQSAQRAPSAPQQMTRPTQSAPAPSMQAPTQQAQLLAKAAALVAPNAGSRVAPGQGANSMAAPKALTQVGGVATQARPAQQSASATQSGQYKQLPAPNAQTSQTGQFKQPAASAGAQASQSGQFKQLVTSGSAQASQTGQFKQPALSSGQTSQSGQFKQLAASGNTPASQSGQFKQLAPADAAVARPSTQQTTTQVSGQTPAATAPAVMTSRSTRRVESATDAAERIRRALAPAPTAPARPQTQAQFLPENASNLPPAIAAAIAKQKAEAAALTAQRKLNAAAAVTTQAPAYEPSMTYPGQNTAQQVRESDDSATLTADAAANPRTQPNTAQQITALSNTGTFRAQNGNKATAAAANTVADEANTAVARAQMRTPSAAVANPALAAQAKLIASKQAAMAKASGSAASAQTTARAMAAANAPDATNAQAFGYAQTGTSTRDTANAQAGSIARTAADAQAVVNAQIAGKAQSAASTRGIATTQTGSSAQATANVSAAAGMRGAANAQAQSNTQTAGDVQTAATARAAASARAGSVAQASGNAQSAVSTRGTANTQTGASAQATSNAPSAGNSRALTNAQAAAINAQNGIIAFSAPAPQAASPPLVSKSANAIIGVSAAQKSALANRAAAVAAQTALAAQTGVSVFRSPASQTTDPAADVGTQTHASAPEASAEEIDALLSQSSRRAKKAATPAAQSSATPKRPASLMATTAAARKAIVAKLTNVLPLPRATPALMGFVGSPSLPVPESAPVPDIARAPSTARAPVAPPQEQPSHVQDLQPESTETIDASLADLVKSNAAAFRGPRNSLLRRVIGIVVLTVSLGGAAYWQIETQGADQLSEQEEMTRQVAFAQLRDITLQSVPKSEIDLAFAQMALDKEDRAALGVLLAEAAEASESGAPLVGSSGSVRLERMILRDTNSPDGDRVAVVSAGFRQEVALTALPQAIVVPVDDSQIIQMVGVTDGSGGGITMGVRGENEEVLMPLMRKGQILSLMIAH